MDQVFCFDPGKRFSRGLLILFDDLADGFFFVWDRPKTGEIGDVAHLRSSSWERATGGGTGQLDDNDVHKSLDLVPTAARSERLRFIKMIDVVVGLLSLA